MHLRGKWEAAWAMLRWRTPLVSLKEIKGVSGYTEIFFHSSITTLLHLYLFSIAPKGLGRCMDEAKGGV